MVAPRAVASVVCGLEPTKQLGSRRKKEGRVARPLRSNLGGGLGSAPSEVFFEDRKVLLAKIPVRAEIDRRLLQPDCLSSLVIDRRAWKAGNCRQQEKRSWSNLKSGSDENDLIVVLETGQSPREPLVFVSTEIAGPQTRIKAPAIVTVDRIIDDSCDPRGRLEAQNGCISYRCPLQAATRWIYSSRSSSMNELSTIILRHRSDPTLPNASYSSLLTVLSGRRASPEE